MKSIELNQSHYRESHEPYRHSCRTLYYPHQIFLRSFLYMEEKIEVDQSFSAKDQLTNLIFRDTTDEPPGGIIHIGLHL